MLLDGFDEDFKAFVNYENRLEELVKNTWRFKYIFLTSRTQFFPSEAKEPFNTKQYRFSLDGPTNHYFKKVYLSPFDDKDVKSYLNKKFPWWKIWKLKNRSKAKNIIAIAPNLMVRPMLLSYIDNLLETTSDNNVIMKRGKLTISYVYDVLINRWIQREANRIHLEDRKSFIENMYEFSKALAVYMYTNKRIKVQDIEIFKIAKDNEIKLTELELKGKSLLNRDSSGYYKFAHKSILEFLLAREAISNRIFGDGVMYFKGLREYEQASLFCTELLVNEIKS